MYCVLFTSIASSSGPIRNRKIKYEEYTFPKIDENPLPIEPSKNTSGFKKRHTSNKHKHKLVKTTSSIKSTFKKGLWGVVLITWCYALVHLYAFSQRYSCLKEIEIDELRKDLHQQVISQDEVIDTVLKSVEDLITRKHTTRVLVFVGSNGVGKTFVSELVASRFPTKLTYKLSYPEQMSSTTVSNDEGCCKLILVDNLKSRHASDLVEFLDTLQSTNLCSLVISIFNIQEVDGDFTPRVDFASVNEIQKTLGETSLNYEVVFFNLIKKSVVDTWLANELDYRNVDVSHRDRIIDFVLADTDFVYSGFKRLQERLKVAVKLYDI